METIQIRLGHTDSVNSVDRQNFLDVQLKNTSKLSHFTDIKETIDQYEQFKTERDNCHKYRLITTINPYCTNVLFNTFTEIVYAEGSDDYCEAIVDGNSFEDTTNTANQTQNVYGNTKPNRMQMIMNTEYSRPNSAKPSKDKNNKVINDENYVYHPGYDIFNNHILRNKSFKIVNKPSSSTNKNFFNTIADKMRYADGSAVTYKRRDDFDDEGNTTIKSRDKHLYDYDNILQFENGDAINANLTEENGWYGFINTSAIQSRDSSEDFEELNIGRVMNDKKSCEFVDMYPDRTLYSFNPKYNKYRHREEYNWEVILTYPYKQTNEPEIVENIDVIIGQNSDGEDVIGERNGLRILSAKRTMGPSGETIILFRSLTKHGLKRGDNVRFYYNDGDWRQYEKDFKVRNVGNLENEEKEYYFYINDMDFIRLLDDSLGETPDNELEVDDTKEYRFARVVANVPSKYYIRIFKKLPNFKYAEQNFPKDGSMTIDEYIENNAKENGEMVLFDKEQYKLAFESTIYNDESTQVTFTDSIDIDNLVDNRGCPVTEIYVTVVKTNYGHDLWYGTEGVTINRKDSGVEFSHCFGKVSSGLQFSQKNEFGGKIYNKRRDLGDISIISHVYNTCYEEDVTINNDEFFGDIVDFNPNECIEKPLQSFLHRFNTAQRELKITKEEGDDRTLKWHEIWSDDWDADPSDDTLIITSSSDYPFSVVERSNEYDYTAVNREEGYYYQPHYRIPLREFGAIIQGQHYDININTITPVQADGIYLKITTIRRSGVNKGDIIYLFDDVNDKIYEFVVTYVENRVSFYVMPHVKSGNSWQYFKNESGMNWLDVCNLSVRYIDTENPNNDRDAQLFFRRKNEDIPSYAEKVGKNKYLWRNVLRVGDMDIQELPEYAYANDAFYVTKEINFFLKRQDPQGWNGLYCKDGFPNDIPGNIKPESNYIYKEEREIIC